jgi:ABC-type transport system involved in multi-copper enzyme maturation permease subunit
MLDWIGFLDDLMYWVQWLTTLAVVGLIGIACLTYFINKKIAVDCGVLVVVLIIVASVFAQFGIQLLPPEIAGFFQNLFN